MDANNGNSSKTVVNPQAAAGSATVVNPQAASGSITAVNPQAAYSSVTAVNSLASAAAADNLVGAVIAGKYRITSRLDVHTGEADLYLSEYEGNKYIVKIYRRKFSVKPEVITRLKAFNSPYIAKLCETGEIGGNTFEVTPYYKNGSLQGHKFSLAELKSKIIPAINEGLKILHSIDIVHKDIKPSNIMLADDGKTVSIIDFGISSVKFGGATVIVTSTGMTPEYSALETFRGLFLDEADYYSFGIVIYELFCGHTPYAKMSPEEIARFTALQRLPFPSDMPCELKELISGLTYNDLTNRHDKNNPNRRWTYAEVSNWLKGIKQPIPGAAMQVQPAPQPQTQQVAQPQSSQQASQLQPLPQPLQPMPQCTHEDDDDDTEPEIVEEKPSKLLTWGKKIGGFLVDAGKGMLAELQRNKAEMDNAYMAGLEMDEYQLVRRFKRESNIFVKKGYAKALEEQGLLYRDEDGTYRPTPQFWEYN